MLRVRLFLFVVRRSSGIADMFESSFFNGFIGGIAMVIKFLVKFEW